MIGCGGARDPDQQPPAAAAAENDAGAAVQRVVGRFVRDAEPQRMKVLNTYGHADDYLTEGVIEFSMFGETLRLKPFTTRPVLAGEQAYAGGSPN